MRNIPVGTIESFVKLVMDDAVSGTFIGACREGDEITVRRLVGKKVDINCTDSDGWTGLYWSVVGGHENIVMFLLTLPGLDVNVASCGRTALQIAAISDLRYIVRLLLNRSDIDLDVKDEEGNTVKDLSSKYKNKEIIVMIDERKFLPFTVNEKEFPTLPETACGEYRADKNDEKKDLMRELTAFTTKIENEKKDFNDEKMAHEAWIETELKYFKEKEKAHKIKIEQEENDFKARANIFLF